MSNLSFRILLLAILILALVCSEPILAQEESPESRQKTTADAAASDQPAKPPIPEEESDAKAEAKADGTPAKTSNDSLQQAIKQLQSQLAEQSKQIEKLQSQYTSEAESRQREIEKQGKQISAQTAQIDTQRQAIQSLQQQVDQASSLATKDISDSEKALRSRLETVEESIKTSREAESTLYDVSEFPGSIPIPGSSAALKFGGFVKMNVVESFDPIGTTDRFIVGTIPVPQQSGANNAALTVNQSRLNIDLRDTTKYGAVRAFLEADFAGVGDTFRLRHAFGQYKSFLIGKTWTTFMDTRSRPEDLDFEGINGRLLLRQPQIRYFPKIGENVHLLLALEDPNPNIAGGQGISRSPDLAVSMERVWFEDWHMKSSLLLRQMDGICNCLDGKKDKVSGWAVSVSGMTSIKLWDEMDNLQLQFNYGKGYSHYVNDLESTNQPDAIFDQKTGRLIPVPVFALYVSFQKWWSPTLRSNFNYGYVDVDNSKIDDPSAYKRTNRLIANIIWSPIARIDLGAQLLFGSRINENNEKGTAKQIQLSAQYRY